MTQLHYSDLEKTLDVLEEALKYHKSKDEMNASTHLAKNVRYSPLTTVLESEVDRITKLVDELREVS